MKTVTLLGATGTIGQNALSIIEAASEQFNLYAVTAKRNVTALALAAKAHHAKVAVIEDESCYGALKDALSGEQVEVRAGISALCDVAAAAEITISGIVGAAALKPTLAAIEAGRQVGLANKECLVCAGDLLMQKVKQHGATIIPVDSEHNAIYQCIAANDERHITKVTLTASGGPFRDWTKEQMAIVTPAQAVKHPNWVMGAKISVDSATMMNKGLELIEARHLFDLQPSQLDVLVHKESMIHGLVEYEDGAVVAGISQPDMRIPLSYALHWPARGVSGAERLNLAEIGSLSFEAPDEKRFPALRLARQVMQAGGAAPCIFNAANEVAVAAFLERKIGFLKIANLVDATLNSMGATKCHSIEALMAVDLEAREMVKSLLHQG